MRALDITLYIIILSATIGFVNALNIFDHDYYATQNSTYVKYQVSDLKEFKDKADNPGAVDILEMTGSLIWDGFWAILKIAFAVVALVPTLIITFGLDTTPETVALYALLQVGIYYIYYTGWAQWRSNKRLGDYQ